MCVIDKLVQVVQQANDVDHDQAHQISAGLFAVAKLDLDDQITFAQMEDLIRGFQAAAQPVTYVAETESGGDNGANGVHSFIDESEHLEPCNSDTYAAKTHNYRELNQTAHELVDDDDEQGLLNILTQYSSVQGEHEQQFLKQRTRQTAFGV